MSYKNLTDHLKYHNPVSTAITAPRIPIPKVLFPKKHQYKIQETNYGDRKQSLHTKPNNQVKLCTITTDDSYSTSMHSIPKDTLSSQASCSLGQIYNLEADNPTVDLHISEESLCDINIDKDKKSKPVSHNNSIYTTRKDRISNNFSQHKGISYQRSIMSMNKQEKGECKNEEVGQGARVPFCQSKSINELILISDQNAQELSNTMFPCKLSRNALSHGLSRYRLTSPVTMLSYNRSFENKQDRDTRTQCIKRLNLQENGGFKTMNRIDNKKIPKEKIKLPFNIAILVHLYHSIDINTRILKQLLPFLDYYDDGSLFFYFSIINTPNAERLNKLVNDIIGTRTKNIEIMHNPNRGGDIGSFLLLTEKLLTSGRNYQYLMFFHTKSNHIWRNTMIKALNTLKLEHLTKFSDIGLIGSNNYLYHFHYTSNNDYEQHLQTISETLGMPYTLNENDKCPFIAGTIFLLNTQVIKGLDPKKLLTLYQRLNTAFTIDYNWQEKMHQLKKKVNGANNDYHYRHLYGKSLHSDFMIEHTLERYIGILVKMSGLKAYGTGISTKY